MSPLRKEVVPLNSPNLSQLFLFLRNDKDYPLSDLLNPRDFLFSFLSHLVEQFEKNHHHLVILEPLLDSAVSIEQRTTLSLDSLEIGEMHLSLSSFRQESSLVYSSPSGLLQLQLLSYDEYMEYKLSDYVLLLHEFMAVLLGVKQLYSSIQPS